MPILGLNMAVKLTMSTMTASPPIYMGGKVANTPPKVLYS